MGAASEFYSVYDLDMVKNDSGVYVFYGDLDDLVLLYIGTSKDLRRRIFSHLSGNSNTGSIYHLFAFVEIFYGANVIDEEQALKNCKPLFNTNGVVHYLSHSENNDRRNKRKELLSKHTDKSLTIHERKLHHLKEQYYNY